MSTKHLAVDDALIMLDKASVLFEVNEFSEGKQCTVNAIYYQLDDYQFIEHVTRKYSISGKVESGYFLYDSPAAILLAMIHSEDRSLRAKAEEFIRKYINEGACVSLSLPQDIMTKVKSLSDKFGCSTELMIINLIGQGLESEIEMNSYCDTYDRRRLLE